MKRERESSRPVIEAGNFAEGQGRNAVRAWQAVLLATLLVVFPVTTAMRFSSTSSSRVLRARERGGIGTSRVHRVTRTTIAESVTWMTPERSG